MQAMEQMKQNAKGKKNKRKVVYTCSVLSCFIYEASTGHDGDKLPFNNVK